MTSKCRFCGCTENAPCLVDGLPCVWVELGLCSACVDADQQDLAFFEDDLGDFAVDGHRFDRRRGLWLPEGLR
jgi:hypothetical protein